MLKGESFSSWGICKCKARNGVVGVVGAAGHIQGSAVCLKQSEPERGRKEVREMQGQTTNILVHSMLHENARHQKVLSKGVASLKG